MALTLPVFIDRSGPFSPARFLVSADSTKTVPAIAFVDSDAFTLSVQLVIPAAAYGDAVTYDDAPTSIGFAIKSAASSATTLANATLTLVEASEPPTYTGTLNLATVNMGAYLATLADGIEEFPAVFDFTLLGDGEQMTYKGECVIARRVFESGLPLEYLPTYPTPAEITQSVADSATALSTANTANGTANDALASSILAQQAAIDAQATADAALPKAGGTMTGDITFDGGIIKLDTTSAPAHAEGNLFYDSTDKTLAYHTDIPAVTVQVGQESHVRIVNKTGATILNGAVVYINGAQGNRPTAALAKADADATCVGVIGVATHDIANDAEGLITTEGLVRSIDTSALTLGADAYLSTTTAGALTSSKPAAPYRAVKVGTVTVQHANQGALLVRVHVPQKMAELSDVSALSPQNGETLTYNTTLGTWVSQIQTQGVAAGQAPNLYLDASVSSADNFTLSSTPSAYAQQTSTTAAFNSGTSPAFVERFVSGPLNTTSVPAGTWTFRTYCASSSTGGTSTIYTRINKRVIVEGMTCAITGTGPTRTLTVTGGAPFVPGDAATILTATLVETPIQTMWISGYTSGSVVTVTLTDSALANFSGQTLNALYYYLFSGESDGITSSSPQLKTYTATIAAPISIGVTDRLVAAYFGKASSGASRTVSLYHGGSAAYSSMNTTFSAVGAASDTAAGIIEIATSDERAIALDNTRALTPWSESGVQQMSNQGITMTLSGTGRIATQDAGGAVYFYPTTDTSTWVEARCFFGASNSTQWPAQRMLRSDRPWSLRIDNVRISNASAGANGEIWIMFGSPVLLSTAAGQFTTGSNGCGFKITTVGTGTGASGVTITPAWFSSTTATGAPTTGTPVSFAAAETQISPYAPFHLLISYNGAGVFTFAYAIGGNRVTIGTSTAVSTAAYMATLFAVQCKHGAGTTTYDLIFSVGKSGRLLTAY